MSTEKTKKETRNFQHEVRSEEGSRHVEGYALLFGVRSDGLWFDEVIERNALDGVLEKSNVFALLNHDMSRGILARWNRKAISLTLEVDEKGLRYSFDAPNTALGDELIESLRRGEINQSSFCFSAEKDTWEKKEDGNWKRTIHKIGQLYDVSPVYDAAYSSTSVDLRGKEQVEAAIEAEKQAIEARAAKELDEYYAKLNKTLFN